jgi:hypothetical protein
MFLKIEINFLMSTGTELSLGEALAVEALNKDPNPPNVINCGAMVSLSCIHYSTCGYKCIAAALQLLSIVGYCNFNFTGRFDDIVLFLKSMVVDINVDTYEPISGDNMNLLASALKIHIIVCDVLSIITYGDAQNPAILLFLLKGHYTLSLSQFTEIGKCGEAISGVNDLVVNEFVTERGFIIHQLGESLEAPCDVTCFEEFNKNKTFSCDEISRVINLIGEPEWNALDSVYQHNLLCHHAGMV